MNLIKKFPRLLSEKGIWLLYFLYTLFIRLPFFFRDYIDRDESSFILMGQSWVDGHLPYTELWDIKPPLTFLFFAITIYLFGKSFIAIRLLGVILITISAFFTFKLANIYSSRKISILTGLLCIILQSLFGSLQGVMSEHIAMAFLIPAIWLCVTSKKNVFRFLLIGVLFGIALMVKLNLAYVGLFTGFIIIISQFKFRNGNMRSIIPATFAYGSGILLVIGFTLLPYYFINEGNLWLNSVIKAPLEYAGARKDSTLRLLSYLIPFIVVVIFSWHKGIFKRNRNATIFLIAAVFGTLVAFYKSGRVNGHYLILIYPLILPFCSFLTVQIKKIKLPAQWILILLFLIPVESYLEYHSILRNKIRYSTFYNGEGITVPQYFKDQELEVKSILFMEYHIGYWVMDKKPITKSATQPSNILKDEMFFAYNNPRKTAGEELLFILEELQPNYIVTRKNRRVFDKKKYAANFYINLQLLNHYMPIDTVENAVVHKRLK